MEIKKGDRIELVYMGEDPDPIPVGTRGTVQLVNPLRFRDGAETQYLIKWDNGRSLSCITPPDLLKVVVET